MIPVVARRAGRQPASYQAAAANQQNGRSKPHLPVGENAIRDHEAERETQVGGDAPGRHRKSARAQPDKQQSQ